MCNVDHHDHDADVISIICWAVAWLWLWWWWGTRDKTNAIAARPYERAQRWPIGTGSNNNSHTLTALSAAEIKLLCAAVLQQQQQGTLHTLRQLRTIRSMLHFTTLCGRVVNTFGAASRLETTLLV